jgi:CubicO group peptidase (beta-lactamase class C family)
MAATKSILLMTYFAATTVFAAAPPPVIVSMEQSVSPLVVIRGEQHPPVSLAMRMSQLKVNAVSIAVVRDGKLDWARAYGFADIERKIAATPDTLFQAGSISKPLAALAALKRVDAGMFSRLEFVALVMSGFALVACGSEELANSGNSHRSPF